MNLAGQVVHKKKKRNATKILAGTPERKRELGRCRFKYFNMALGQLM
jgi:hypothetical protein